MWRSAWVSVAAAAALASRRLHIQLESDQCAIAGACTLPLTWAPTLASADARLWGMPLRPATCHSASSLPRGPPWSRHWAKVRDHLRFLSGG
jgi:hypothetical protein